MPTSSAPRVRRRSPATPLAIGVSVALLAIAAAGAYTFGEIRRLRDDQTTISERNRKGSLQLLRIQNDLASLAVLLRDMADGTEPYPLHGWQPALDRVRRDLTEATALERTLAPAVRDPAQQTRLIEMSARYGRDLDRMFELSKSDEPAARRMIRASLVAQHRELDGLVSQFLIANNRVQQEAAEANRAIYDQVGREILLLIGALLAATALAGAWMVVTNRRAFDDVAGLSAQLRTLSWRTLRLQEDLQRSIARELHDDFGQILTAIGTLLGRARRRAATPDALAEELDGVRAVAQQTLDRIRTRSRWLHPGVLDDFGLLKALEHFTGEFEQQSGVRVRMSVTGAVDAIGDDCAIHVYRIVQEALSNVARHAKSSEAMLRLTRTADALELDVEDRGVGMPPDVDARATRGLGLISMRERAELMGGALALTRPEAGGVLLRVRIPMPAPGVASPAKLHGAPEVA